MNSLKEAFEKAKKAELEKQEEDSRLKIAHDKHGRLVFEKDAPNPTIEESPY